MEEVAFFAGAIGALGGAIAVIALRNPFYSVLALVVHLVLARRACSCSCTPSSSPRPRWSSTPAR